MYPPTPPQRPGAMPPPTPAGESIVAPSQVLTLDQMIDQEATKAGVRPDLLRRVIQTESAGNPRAVSKKGAIGLGQLMPGTAKDLGVNPQNPMDNVRGAATYLRQQLDTFGGDEAKALAAYNAGPTPVKKYGGVPPYKETQAYVGKIQGGPPAAPAAAARAPLPTPVSAVPQAQESIVHPSEISLTPPQAAPQVAGLTPPPAPPPGYGLTGGRLRQVASGLEQGSPERYLTEGLASGLEGATALATGVKDWVASKFSSGDATRNTMGALLPIAGGVVGGMAGARGGLGTAMGAAGLGQATGELGAMAVDYATGAPPTAEEFTRRYTEAFGAGAVGELGGQAVSKVAGKVMAPMKGKLTEYGKQALEKYGPKLEGRGLGFTPDAVTEHRGLDIAANLTSGIGGGKYKRFQEATGKFFETEERGRLLEQFGDAVTPEKAGTIWKAAREAGTETFHRRAETKYAEVAAKAGEAKIPMTSLRAFADTELAKRTAIPGEVSGDTGLRLLKQLATKPKEDVAEAALAGTPIGGRSMAQMQGQQGGKELIDTLRKAGVLPQEATELPDELTYEQAHFFASELKKLIREKSGGQTKDARLVGVTKQVLKHLEAATDEALPEEARQAYRATNAWYKTETERLDSNVLRKVAKKDPELIAQAIVKGGRTTLIRAAREAVPEAHWRKIQADTVRRLLIDKHGDLEAGSKMVEKLTKLTPETINEVFPKGEAAEVIQVARILDQVERNREGTGKMFIQLSQAGAVANAAAGGKVGKVARGTLVIPWAAAQLLTSKLGRTWLTEGLTAPPGSAAFNRAVTQAGAWLAKEAMHSAQSSAYGEAWKGDPNAPANPFGTVKPGGPPPPNPFERR